MAKIIDLSDGGPRLSWFQFPKTFPINLRNSFAPYEGGNPASLGPTGNIVGSYTSPVAPQNTLPTRVIFDGSRSVSF